MSSFKSLQQPKLCNNPTQLQESNSRFTYFFPDFLFWTFLWWKLRSFWWSPMRKNRGKRPDPLVRSLPATVIVELHPSESNGRIYQLCTSSRCYNRTPRSIPFLSSKVIEVNIATRATQRPTDRRINSNNSGFNICTSFLALAKNLTHYRELINQSSTWISKFYFLLDFLWHC